MRPLLAPLVLPIAFLFSGCSLLFGNILPTTERSSQYEIFNPAQENSEWLPLESEPSATQEEADASASDIAFQSKTTGTILSLNSACRPALDWGLQAEEGDPAAYEREQLKQFSRQLLLGIEPTEPLIEKYIEVSQLPALETTLTGTLAGASTKVRTVVLRKGTCVYDLMYVTKPQFFDADEPTFRRFVASLRVNR
jgi:hypothetical protein